MTKSLSNSEPKHKKHCVHFRAKCTRCRNISLLLLLPLHPPQHRHQLQIKPNPSLSGVKKGLGLPSLSNRSLTSLVQNSASDGSCALVLCRRLFERSSGLNLSQEASGTAAACCW